MQFRSNVPRTSFQNEADEREAELVTADHHEFDSLEEKGEAKFYWIR